MEYTFDCAICKRSVSIYNRRTSMKNRKGICVECADKEAWELFYGNAKPN